jgi:hypothetical protein
LVQELRSRTNNLIDGKQDGRSISGKQAWKPVRTDEAVNAIVDLGV